MFQNKNDLKNWNINVYLSHFKIGRVQIKKGLKGLFTYYINGIRIPNN